MTEAASPPSGWNAWVDERLDDVRRSNRLRSNRVFDAHGPVGVLDGRRVVSYASNDYLGLSTHPAVAAAARAAIDRWGTGATASRLVVGTRPVHVELEEAYADHMDTERALVFASGYAANLGVLTTFGGPDVTVFSDERNHASIIDGCRLSRSRTVVYRHNDMGHLAELLGAADGRTVVVTDAVFSMDGDEAPVSQLAELCARHGALLVLDEAHSVLGPTVPRRDDLDLVRVGTLSKALGSIGGVVAASAPVIDLLVNQARSFIFSTGLAPADAAAAMAALEISRSAEGDERRALLRRWIDRLVPGHPSPIVPVVLGAESEAIAASEALLRTGALVPAIRPPTVAPGTCRLRIALSAAHDEEMIDLVVTTLADLGIEP